MRPGEILPAPGEIELNAGRATITLRVANTGDRPVQVGSHYHFAETNSALDFDRAVARGLDVHVAGTAFISRLKDALDQRYNVGKFVLLLPPDDPDGVVKVRQQSDACRRYGDCGPRDRFALLADIHPQPPDVAGADVCGLDEQKQDQSRRDRSDSSEDPEVFRDPDLGRNVDVTG